jgi:hypothetical protein
MNRKCISGAKLIQKFGCKKGLALIFRLLFPKLPLAFSQKVSTIWANRFDDLGKRFRRFSGFRELHIVKGCEIYKLFLFYGKNTGDLLPQRAQCLRKERNAFAYLA